MDEYFYHFTDEKRDTYPWCANSASASRGIKHSVSRLASHLSRGTTSGFKMKTSGVEFFGASVNFWDSSFPFKSYKKNLKTRLSCPLSSFFSQYALSSLF